MGAKVVILPFSTKFFKYFLPFSTKFISVICHFPPNLVGKPVFEISPPHGYGSAPLFCRSWDYGVSFVG